MMSPKKLFRRRLLGELKFQFSVWKSAIDWTVALYIILPALAFAIYQYLLWWQNPPFWLNLLPADLLFAMAFFFAWSGTMRVFLREEDQLFLLYKKQWLKQIIKYGLIYSFALDLLFSMFFILLLAPFILLYYKFSLLQLTAFFLLTFLSKVFLGLAKQLLTLRFSGWRQFIVLKGSLILGTLLFAASLSKMLENFMICIVTILILFITGGILSSKRINYQGAFLADVDREQNERLKYVDLLLSLAGINMKKPRKQRKRPWLFPNSGLIFKERNAVNGLAELAIKLTLRNRRHLLQYLQFVLFCIFFQIMGIPDSLRWLMWLVFAFAFIGFAGLLWKENLASEFMELFYLSLEDQQFALRKFLFIMTLPGLLLISITTGLLAFSWLGALLIIPVSISLVFYLCRIMAFYLI
ncbi:MAG: ABC transporter permease [Peptococcaceae bacterium]